MQGFVERLEREAAEEARLFGRADKALAGSTIEVGALLDLAVVSLYLSTKSTDRLVFVCSQEAAETCTQSAIANICADPIVTLHPESQLKSSEVQGDYADYTLGLGAEGGSQEGLGMLSQLASQPDLPETSFAKHGNV